MTTASIRSNSTSADLGLVNWPVNTFPLNIGQDLPGHPVGAQRRREPRAYLLRGLPQHLRRIRDFGVCRSRRHRR